MRAMKPMSMISLRTRSHIFDRGHRHRDTHGTNAPVEVSTTTQEGVSMGDANTQPRGIHNMRPATKLIAAAVISAFGLAACGASGTKVSSATTVAANGTLATKNSPVGFNAARTAFNLPHKLGLLPSDELALAKSDSAYAAGLANLGDWVQSSEKLISASGSAAHPATQSPTWYYVGATTGLGSSAVVDVKNTETGWNSIIVSFYGATSLKVLRSTAVPINDSKLNVLISTAGHFAKGAVPGGGYQLVAPGNLEIQAAPVGFLYIGVSVKDPAFCVPMPYAYLASNKVATPNGMPVMTAGPSTVFALSIPAVGQATQPAGASASLYDRGVASCATFK